MNTEIEKEAISNMQKHDNYVEQFKRLKAALEKGFNLEAIFIEYTIIEDRTESILRHGRYWDAYTKSRKGREVNLDSKVRYIAKQAENRKSAEHKYFSDTLLEDILVWKEERNRLIHALLKQALEEAEISDIALKGELLAKSLRTVTERYKRAIAKLNCI